mgnify:CR=1 FL=1
MQIFLPTIGSAGDVFPLIGLGQTLQRRGHEVMLGVNPLFEEVTRAVGLGYVPLGTRAEAEAVLQDSNLWSARRGFETVARKALIPALRPLLEAIRRFDPAEVVIGASPLAFAARVAQERWGYRVATVLLQPALLRSVHDTPINGVALPGWWPATFKRLFYRFTDRAVVDPLIAPPLNRLRGDLELPPIERPLDGWLFSPACVLGLFPEWYAPRQPDWPDQLALTGFMLHETGLDEPLPPALDAFLAAGEPPLLFTAGSAMQHGDDFFREAVAASRRLGRRAVLVTRDGAQVPRSLPETILYLPYVSFGRLLPHVSLIVHHGGIGTVARALAAAVPQLIMPLSHDQPDNARRVARLGVGRSIAPRRFRAARVAAQIDGLLDDPTVAARCAEIARRVDAESAREESARLLESL